VLYKSVIDIDIVFGISQGKFVSRHAEKYA